jgi:hypothetical protein
MDYNSLQNRYSWNTAKVGVKHQPAIKIQYLPKRYIIDELHKYNSFFCKPKKNKLVENLICDWLVATTSNRNRLNAWVSEILNAYILHFKFFNRDWIYILRWKLFDPPVATAQEIFSNEILCCNFGTNVFVYYW